MQSQFQSLSLFIFPSTTMPTQRIQQYDSGFVDAFIWTVVMIHLCYIIYHTWFGNYTAAILHGATVASMSHIETRNMLLVREWKEAGLLEAKGPETNKY